MPLLQARLKQDFQVPFLSDNEVTYGATLSTKTGTAFATTDDSYESIGSKISFAFESNLRPHQLAVLTNDTNNDVAANAYAKGYGEKEGVWWNQMATVIGVTPSTTGSDVFSKSYTKAETAPGGTCNFKIKDGTTISDVIVAAPRAGKSASLRKDRVRAINSHYLQATIDSGGYKTVTIRPAEYDEWTNFTDLPKTVTVETGKEYLV